MPASFLSLANLEWLAMGWARSVAPNWARRAAGCLIGLTGAGIGVWVMILIFWPSSAWTIPGWTVTVPTAYSAACGAVVLGLTTRYTGLFRQGLVSDSGPSCRHG